MSVPRDPITETENGFMEPKYYAFRFGDWTPWTSSSENMTIDLLGVKQLIPVRRP